jgi:serine/threonine-protein kinase
VKKPWSSSIDVAARQTEARVTVTLEDEPKPVAAVQALPPAPVAAPVQAAPPPASNTQRTAGIVVTAAGVAGLAVGSFFGLEAMSKNSEALLPRNCPTSTRCYDAGLSLTSDAKTFATVSTIAFSVGGAAVLGGAILWLTAPSSSAAPRDGASLRIVPDATPSYAGALLRGRW